MGRSESSSAEPVVADKSDGIAVMDQRIVAGDFFVNRHQYFLFPDQLQQVTEL